MTEQDHMSLPLAISIGEPSGIGAETLLKAWLRRHETGLPAFYALADPAHLAGLSKKLGLSVPLAETAPQDAVSHYASHFPVVPLDNRFHAQPGLPSSNNAAGVIEAIERAVQDVVNGCAAALVTCPIAKKPLYEAGFEYPGHTEFLGHLAHELMGAAPTPVMMLAGPDLRTVPVTVHVSLADAIRTLTTEMIVSTARITARDLKARFGIAKPRLAIAGLNPHAGEGGSMGHEDESIIAPAVAALQAEGIDAFGPLPSDTMFHARARAGYDAALCMYHDQALIPVKALAFDQTVNVTLGLPFIRTSPDHGTAFDIAGKGIAMPDSLESAMHLARKLGNQALTPE